MEDIERVLFFTVATHQCQSSLSQEAFMPFLPFDDRKMFVVGVKKRGTCKTADMLKKLN